MWAGLPYLGYFYPVTLAYFDDDYLLLPTLAEIFLIYFTFYLPYYSIILLPFTYLLENLQLPRVTYLTNFQILVQILRSKSSQNKKISSVYWLQNFKSPVSLYQKNLQSCCTVKTTCIMNHSSLT